MKTAVCFKLIPDYNQLPSDAWKRQSVFRSKAELPDMKYASVDFGFFDAGALETALRIKDAEPSVILEAVSLGKENSLFTESLYAVGYDKVTYLESASDFDSKNTASELAEYLKKENFDLVLTGESVGPLDSGSVPYLMAHRLNCSVLNSVTEIALQDGALLLKRETEELIESYRAEDSDLPLIAVISNAKYPYLRMARYESKQKAKTMPANIIKAANGRATVNFILPKEKKRNTEFTDKQYIADLLRQFGGDKP